MNREDALGRETFIDLLEGIIERKIESGEGISLAIDGKWGCGKTFLLNRLEKKLDEKKYLVFHYNCWENDFYEEPLVAILQVIVAKIKTLKPTSGVNRVDWKQIRPIALKFFGSVISMLLKNKIGIDLGKLKFNVDLETLIKDGKTAITNEEKAILSTDFDSMQSMKQCLAQVRKALQCLKMEWKGIILVVDELDRCLPEYAIKVMERLHHICFNTDTDKYDFVLLTAINKSEMLGSIARSFGRSFEEHKKVRWNIDQSNNTPGNGGTGRINGTIDGKCSDELFYESQERFASYYLQKFIEMIVPVPEPKQENNSLDILGGFEKDFSDEGMVKTYYAEELISKILNKLPMRYQLNVVNQVKTIHQITKINLSTETNPSLAVLCAEVLDTIFASVFKIKGFLSLHIDNESIYLRTQDSLKRDFLDEKEGMELRQALAQWSMATCYESSYSRYNKYNIQMRSASSFVCALYRIGKTAEQVNLSTNIPCFDMTFIKEFRKILNTLVA